MSKQMKTNFKVGDRVAVYGCFKGVGGRHIGEVRNICGNGSLRIEFGCGLYDNAYPQQCRRLVKKPREVVWVGLRRYNWTGGVDDFLEAIPGDKPDFNTANGKSWREFREVRRAK